MCGVEDADFGGDRAEIRRSPAVDADTLLPPSADLVLIDAARTYDSRSSGVMLSLMNARTVTASVPSRSG
jgi:hypothetical protein